VGPEHCVIREVFLEVKQAVEEILGRTTLADLVHRQREILDNDIRIPADVYTSVLPILQE
jgi:DNA-binding IscR family transcriptional regulator